MQVKEDQVERIRYPRPHSSLRWRVLLGLCVICYTGNGAERWQSRLALRSLGLRWWLRVSLASHKPPLEVDSPHGTWG